jgi:hypothetical protein
MSPGVTAKLVASGLVAALVQLSALALRHWWPLGLAVGVVWRRARLLIALAAVIDVAVEYFRVASRMNPLQFALARRLDDIAYGSGVWYASLRARSARALIPELRPERRAAAARGRGAG